MDSINLCFIFGAAKLNTQCQDDVKKAQDDCAAKAAAAAAAPAAPATAAAAPAAAVPAANATSVPSFFYFQF